MRTHQRRRNAPDPASIATNWPQIAALYDKAFACGGNVPNMFAHGPPPEIYATYASAISRGAEYRHGSHQTERADHRPHQQVNEHLIASQHTISPATSAWTDDQAFLHLADWTQTRPTSLPLKSRAAFAETVTRMPRTDEHACPCLFRKVRNLQIWSPLPPSACSTTQPSQQTRSKMERHRRWAGSPQSIHASIQRTSAFATSFSADQRTKVGESTHSFARTLAQHQGVSSTHEASTSPALSARHLFDCDGTIVTPLPLHSIAWKQALGEVGLYPRRRSLFTWR